MFQTPSPPITPPKRDLEVSIERHISDNDPDRISLPKTLPPYIPIPVDSGHDIIPIYKALRSDISVILKNESIKWRTYSAYKMKTDSGAQDKIVVSILAHQNKIDPSRLAVQAIHHLFSINGAPWINVEIFDPERSFRPCYFPITDPSHFICRAYKVVRQPIKEQVNSALASQWSKICPYLCGKTEESAVPTLVVTVRPGSITNWNALIKSIEDILRNSSLNGIMAITYDIGSVSLAEARDYWIDTDAISPKGGSSIGLTDEPRASGTLGGFFYLDVPDRTPMLCALTCHHVILPTDKDKAEVINANGVDINNQQDPGRSTVRYPSLFDINKAIQIEEELAQTLQERCDQTSDLIEKEMVIEESPQYQDWIRDLDQRNDIDQRKKALLEMKEKKSFASVLASSGMRIGPNGNRLDWSLLKVEDATFHINYAPLTRSIPTAHNPKGVYAIFRDKEVSEFSVLPLHGFTLKNGRSTSITTGQFSAIQPDVQWEGTDQKSLEWELVSYIPELNYCERGDSGAFVLDKSGALCAILIGQHNAVWSRQHGAGIATPIDDILDDIKLRTGGTLRLPQP
jgi:hypothetical protein